MARFRLTTGCALTLCLVVSGSAQDSDIRGELMEHFLEAIPSDTITDAEMFEINGFHLQSSQNSELGADFQPTGNHMQFLSVTAEDIFKVVVEKGRPMSTGGGIGIFHRESGTPMLTAADQDGDGRVDVLTYGVFDDSGEHVLGVYGAVIYSTPRRYHIAIFAVPAILVLVVAHAVHQRRIGTSWGRIALWIFMLAMLLVPAAGRNINQSTHFRSGGYSGWWAWERRGGIGASETEGSVRE